MVTVGITEVVKWERRNDLHTGRRAGVDSLIVILLVTNEVASSQSG